MATYWENSCSFGLRYVSWYKYLIVSLVFSHLGFWSGNLFLIAPFPDLCLLVPFWTRVVKLLKVAAFSNLVLKSNNFEKIKYAQKKDILRNFQYKKAHADPLHRFRNF